MGHLRLGRLANGKNIFMQIQWHSLGKYGTGFCAAEPDHHAAMALIHNRSFTCKSKLQLSGQRSLGPICGLNKKLSWPSLHRRVRI